jgi:hypothetical protein
MTNYKGQWDDGNEKTSRSRPSHGDVALLNMVSCVFS